MGWWTCQAKGHCGWQWGTGTRALSQSNRKCSVGGGICKGRQRGSQKAREKARRRKERMIKLMLPNRWEEKILDRMGMWFRGI